MSTPAAEMPGTPAPVDNIEDQPQNSPRRGGLRLAHLWVITPFALAWLLQSTSSIEPFDFWWNVKSGEIMARTGEFLGTDVLVWTPVRMPYSNPQWGSQLLFYWLYNLSPYLLLTVRVLILVAALGVVYALCRSRSGSQRAAGIATMIALLTGLTNYGMRPQLFAFLPFAVFLFLLGRKDTHPAWLPALVPTMLFWVNVHGSFFLGIAMLGIYALGTLLERIGSPQGRKWLVSRQAAWQAGCFAAAAIATLANPYFDFVYRYFFIATNDPVARSLNIEWQPPTIYDGTGILFYTNLAIFIASVYFSRRRMRPTEILLVAAFAYLALTSLRNVLWWGWVTAPILAANFAAIGANRAARRAEQQSGQSESAASTPEGRERVEVPALNWLIAAVLVGGPLLLTPLWRPVNPLVSEADKPAVESNTPVKVAQYIKENRPPAPLFNYMEWGGYLEWELYPQYKLFIDGRFEARVVDVWHDYLSVSRARADWQATLDRYGVNTLVLNKDWHDDLVPFVEKSSIWHKAYEDDQAIVFTRAGATSPSQTP